MDQTTDFLREYTQMAADDSLSALFLSASRTHQMDAILDTAWNTLHKPMVVTDALHYVIGTSPDVAAQFHGQPTWTQLIEAKLVPDAAQPAEPGVPGHGETPQDSLLGSNLRLHFASDSDTAAHYMMCDIMEEQVLLLKLAIRSNAPFSGPEIQTMIALANALHLAFFRLRNHSGTMLNEQERYLLKLLHGAPHRDASWVHFESNMQGPYWICCTDMQHIGFHNLTFLNFLKQNLPLGYAAVQDDSFYVMLIPNAHRQGDLTLMQNYADSHHMTIALSDLYTDLAETPAQYDQLKALLSVANQFSGNHGIIRRENYLLYLMFEQISPQTFFHPDAETLLDYDKKHDSDLVRTLFCWLLYQMKSTAASEKMFVHRNTMDHRIAKIQGILNRPWNDQAYVFQMLYSLYRVLQREHRLVYY